MKKKLAQIFSKFFIGFYKLRYGSKVSFGKGVIVNHKFYLKGKGKLIIEDNVNLWAHAEVNSFHFYSEKAVIKIGSKSRVNGLDCHSAKSISIGKNCLIGSAKIMDTDFHSFSDPKHVLYENKISKPVKVGDGVWLAGQCVLLKGVEIGEKSVVGFRAVVSRSFPKNVVIAGNPAKIVKEKMNKFI